jgi:hypothetical protein
VLRWHRDLCRRQRAVKIVDVGKAEVAHHDVNGCLA